MSFASIADKYPTERVALTKLQRFLAKHSSEHSEFTLDMLCDLLQPQSRDELAMALGELVRKGEIKKVVRVVSPTTQGGIKDFDSLEKIPRFIHDWRNDVEIEVNPDLLRTVYIT